MRNIYLGDRGVLVQYLQLALTRAGYPVELDGIFGTDTCKALREFRREYAMHGETVGCYVDQSVWKQLIPYLKGYVTCYCKGRYDMEYSRCLWDNTGGSIEG